MHEVQVGFRKEVFDLCAEGPLCFLKVAGTVASRLGMCEQALGSSCRKLGLVVVFLAVGQERTSQLRNNLNL